MFMTIGVLYLSAKYDYDINGLLGPMVIDAIAWLGLTNALNEFAYAGCF